MAKWQPYQGWRAWAYTKTAIIVVAIIGLWFGRSVWQSFWRQRLVVADRQQLSGELDQLKARENKLQDEIGSLKTESGMEEKIREKFPVIKAGEKVITIVASDTATTSATTSPSWWQKLFKRD